MALRNFPRNVQRQRPVGEAVSAEEERYARHVALKAALAASVPPASFGPAPFPCQLCGRPWRGMVDDGRFTACCGTSRADALRHIDAWQLREPMSSAASSPVAAIPAPNQEKK